METPIWFDSAISSIVSGLFLMLVGGFSGWLFKTFNELKTERNELNKLKDTMLEYEETYKNMALTFKNINRASIITICNEALLKSYISDISFKCLCELEESYHGWHGNSYTDELIEKVKIMYQHQSTYPSVLRADKQSNNK